MHSGRPSEPVGCHVAPASRLLKMPVVPAAYHAGDVLLSTAIAVGVPEGRLLSGRHVRPASRVTANCVPVLRLPSVTGKS